MDNFVDRRDMGVNWKLKCKTCNVEMDESWNHGEEALAEFLTAWEWYVKQDFLHIEMNMLGDTSRDCNVFMENHSNHEIQIVSERGWIFTKEEIENGLLSTN